MDDEKKRRQPMVILFGPCFSGRFTTLARSVAFCAGLFLAAFTSSIPRWLAVHGSPRMIEARCVLKDANFSRVQVPSGKAPEQPVAGPRRVIRIAGLVR
jgi:hypothetical protein